MHTNHQRGETRKLVGRRSGNSRYIDKKMMKHFGNRQRRHHDKIRLSILVDDPGSDTTFTRRGELSLDNYWSWD
jgi:hypothetical protein